MFIVMIDYACMGNYYPIYIYGVKENAESCADRLAYAYPRNHYKVYEHEVPYGPDPQSIRIFPGA